jgi:hypothetical protein
MNSLRKIYRSLSKHLHQTIKSKTTTAALNRKADEDEPEECFEKFKKKQEFFQQKDSIPIHLKCGLRDKILYYITLILAGFGLSNTIGFIFHMSLPMGKQK